MIRSFDGKTPKISESAFISETAYIVGDVEIGDYSNVWPGAVIRGDLAHIKIGRYVDIEDNCVLHAGHDIEIGDNVEIGHGAMVHCAKIGNSVLIGMNATMLPNSQIGDNSIVAAGALVTDGMKVPPNSLVAGVPAKVKGQVKKEQRRWIDEHFAFYPGLAKRYKDQKL